MEKAMLRRIGVMCMLLALAAMLVVGGCKRRDKDNENADEPSAQSKPKYASKGDEGTVSGTVKFDGTPPTPKKIDMSADANCASAQGDKTTDDVSVDAGKLANVFVYIKGGSVDKFKYDQAADAAVLDQQGCRYHPHVLGLQTGQTLRVLNSDPTTHNVHPSPRVNQEWNQSQPPSAAPIEKKFNRKETLIPVKCNQHPWMKAYIGVLDHPYYAVSAKDGTYSIKNVPPGNYTLVFWHETLGEQTQNITVAAKESKTQDISYKSGTAYRATSLEVAPALVLP
jgi:plastocyanin